ncbi:MAG: hypothetical protein FWD40_05035 [Treponema sp.]|nr:hypothetical protein [Treponema sp.]
MKQFLLLPFFIFFAVCALTGCPQPVGVIGGNGNGNISDKGASDFDFLWLVPNRYLYETEERFERDYDLQILVAEDGYIKKVAPDESGVVIEIIENPGLSSENSTIVTSTFHPFSLPGRHIVNVEYNGKSAHYSIEVRGTFTNPGDGSDFIDIIWL